MNDPERVQYDNDLAFLFALTYGLFILVVVIPKLNLLR